jgi:hypothetical protein
MMRMRSSYIPLVTVCISLACAAAPSLDDLYAQQVMLKQAEQDYRQRAKFLAGGEADDYRVYLEGLRDRLAKDCHAMRLAGVVLPADLDCPRRDGKQVAPLERSPAQSLTETEQTERLDAELEAGLGEYDELLLREQARVKADRPRSAGEGDGIAGGAGGESDGDAGSADADGQPTDPGDEQMTDARTGKPPVATGSGAGKQTVTGGQPENIPDGSDDDVVARQLRKAAEQETDPQLKKKLWEEYRKYKQGTRSQ